MKIEHHTTNGKDDRIEWWDKEDFIGRSWRLRTKKVRAMKVIPDKYLICGLCGGSLDYPCPIWRGYPLCRSCYMEIGWKKIGVCSECGAYIEAIHIEGINENGVIKCWNCPCKDAWIIPMEETCMNIV